MRHFKNGILLIHLAFVLIAVGAVCTACLSVHGSMHLYPRETTNSFVLDDNHVRHLPIPLTLISFEIEYYRDSDNPKDYKSTILTAEGDTLRISMNHIGRLPGGYRLYQSSYDEYGGSWLTVTCDPVGTTLVYLGFLLFSIGFIFDVAFRLGNALLRKPEIYALAVTCVSLLLCIIFMNPNRDGLLPVLATWWMPIHVGFAAAGYVVLASSIPLCIAALADRNRRKYLATLSLRIVASGVLLLGIGIILGSLWANVSWGRYWGWDPKETWALVTFIIYAIPLHSRLGFKNRPALLSIYFLVSSLSIAMTYWGVSYLPSLHSYLQ